jgi:hypothetical protein
MATEENKKSEEITEKEIKENFTLIEIAIALSNPGRFVGTKLGEWAEKIKEGQKAAVEGMYDFEAETPEQKQERVTRVENIIAGTGTRAFTTTTPSPQRVFDTSTEIARYEEARKYEEETGQLYIPKSVDDIPLNPEFIKSVKGDANKIREKKIQLFSNMIIQPFKETRPGSGVFIKYNEDDEWARREKIDGKEIQTYTEEEAYAIHQTIINTVKESEDYENIVTRAYVDLEDPILDGDGQPIGYHVVTGKGDFKRKLTLTPQSSIEAAEALLESFDKQLQTLFSAEAGDSFEEYVKARDELDEILMLQKEQQRAAYETDLVKYMANNYINWVEEDSFNQTIEELVDGNLTLDQVKQSYQDDLIARYPALESKLKEGKSFKDIADYYIYTMANTLELAPDNIDLGDTAIQSALTHVDEKGNVSMKPLWQFEREIKMNDERYRYTTKARTDMANLARDIAEMFGAR